jgi:hypothetical protein
MELYQFGIVCIIYRSAGADVLVDERGERGDGDDADEALLPAALEDEDGGDATDTALGRHVEALVRVHLAALDLVGIHLGQLVDHRSDHPAGPTAGRPELHQHRRVSPHHHLLSVRIGGGLEHYAPCTIIIHTTGKITVNFIIYTNTCSYYR